MTDAPRSEPRPVIPEGTSRPRLAAPTVTPPNGTVRPSRQDGISTIEIAALVLSFSWLGLIGWFFLTLDPAQARLSARDPLGFMMTILGVFLPVALVWVAASAARTARTMREESARLQAAIDAMRLSYVEQQQMAGVSLKRAMEERIDTVARAQAVLGAEVAGLHAAAPREKVLEAPARPETPQQPTLALEARTEGDPLPPEDFIRAMNFPENERDTEGFRVLRRALEHHQTAQLITAAQDVLTLLSQEKIYMDDLSPHRAEASIWRGFANGMRGEDIKDLAGVRDRSSLALTSARMKRDPVFRDAVHHFLRTFDHVFAAFCDDATDSEITRMTDTRTARAFMLCGRVAGIFE